MGDGSFKDLKKAQEDVRQAVRKDQRDASISQGEHVAKSSAAKQNKPTGLTALEVGWGKNLKE
jgi:hypothetical protein